METSVTEEKLGGRRNGDYAMYIFQFTVDVRPTLTNKLPRAVPFAGEITAL